MIENYTNINVQIQHTAAPNTTIRNYKTPNGRGLIHSPPFVQIFRQYLRPRNVIGVKLA